MRNRLYLYVLPVLAIVACKEALPLVDGGDPEGDAQTPEQDASSLTDGALADTASPDASSDASAPQDGGGDALDASADAYVAPSEDGGVVTGYVRMTASLSGQWSVASDGGGVRPCSADAAVVGNCCMWPIAALEDEAMVPFSFNVNTGDLTVNGIALPALQVVERDAGYFEGRRNPSDVKTNAVALSIVDEPPAQRAEAAAFFGQPRYFRTEVGSFIETLAKWDRTTRTFSLVSIHAPQYLNDGCRSTGRTSFRYLPN